MIFFLIYPITFIAFAFEEYFEWMEHKDWKKYDKLEKIASVFHRLSLIATGYFYPYGIKEILFFLVIYWVMTDGLQNLLKNRNFFAISDSTMNPIEKWSTWYVKLILFIISILIMVFL
jgi:succinate dehydrogenase/fumarate reductase cytochrome b subunit